MNLPREYAQRIADALVDVVEDARWEARISSVRELARRAGMTHTALNKRMNHETPFSVRDLAAVALVLEIHPAELLRLAKARVDGDGPDELAGRRGRPSPGKPPAYSMDDADEAAARDEDREKDRLE